MPNHNDDIRPPKGFGFWVIDDKDKKVYMVLCFGCGKENWGPAVASGSCAWCGYDANRNHKSLAQHTISRK